MAKIFWFACPECAKESYAQWEDFRHTDNKLVCPYCHATFLDEEAVDLVE